LPSTSPISPGEKAERAENQNRDGHDPSVFCAHGDAAEDSEQPRNALFLRRRNATRAAAKNKGGKERIQKSSESGRGTPRAWWQSRGDPPGAGCVQSEARTYRSGDQKQRCKGDEGKDTGARWPPNDINAAYWGLDNRRKIIRTSSGTARIVPSRSQTVGP